MDVPPGTDYTKDRRLLDYQRLLGRDFTELLFTLTDAQHWIDAGAGRALAACDYLEADVPGPRATVTAVGLDKPDGVAGLETRFGPKLRYLAGRAIEDIDLDELGKADLITDIYGPLQYSMAIHRVVETYARLLRPGGALWTMLPALTFVKNEGDRGLLDWLSSVEGLTVLRAPAPEATAGEIVFIRGGEDIRVPPVRLTRTYPGPPPFREFAPD